MTSEFAADESTKLWTLQLYREFDETLLYYRIRLPRPHIQLSESRTRYGSYDPLGPTLTISDHLIREHSWDVVLEVLKHEMAHMLVGESSMETAHGPAFQEACSRLGLAPWARHAHIEVDPATAVQQHRQLSAEQERLLRRVEKLLSLATSSHEHEASLAMQRARELCARHQFENFGTDATYTYVLIQHDKKVIPAHQASISSILCNHFYVDCVTRHQFDAKTGMRYKVLEILGTRENVQMAEYVYWFLWNQLPLLWRHYRQEKFGARSELKRGQSRAPRVSQRSFYLGVLRGFDDKLSLQKASLGPHGASEGLIALEAQERSLEARLQANLRQFVRERFPHLHRSGGRRHNLAADDFAGGRQRGRELNLHRGLTESHRGAIQLLHSGKG